MKISFKILMMFAAIFLLNACTTKMEYQNNNGRDIIGNNAFLYYKNYDEAVEFYGIKMGFKNVFEFPGFAIIYQTSPTTFITLVNDDGSGRGMHSADSPKTIAIALLTDQIDGWYDYALSQEMDIRNPPKPLNGSPHNGFLVTDPGGYILEFEYFAQHEENIKFTPLLEASTNIYAVDGSERPSNLGFKASIYWLYHKDADQAADFYRDVMGLEMIVKQPFSDIYTSSATGYIGLVLDGVGIHDAVHEKAVNVGFMTSNAAAWFDHLKDQPTFELRTKELYHEQDGDGNVLIDIVIGYDPDNYYIEIDQFLDKKANAAIRQALGL